MNEMELQTTLDPIEMDMGDPEIIYSPVLPNPVGDPTDDLTKVQIQGNIFKIKDPEVHDWARAEEKPTYTKEEVGLENVDNTSDMDKPVSTATQTALNNKVDKVAGKGLSTNDFTNDFKTKLEGIEAGAEVNTVNSVAGKTGNVTLDKTDVGLSNVDNTSDLNKPVSTATQSALNGKVDNSTLNSYYTKTETDSALANKVDKIDGKGLSTNDYDDTAKGIVDGVTSALNGKVDKEEGYGLSQNDYSDEEKAKVGEIDNKLDKTETAVNANGLVIATPINDNAPYIYRQTPVKESFKALMKKIVGASVVWNQLISRTSGWNGITPFSSNIETNTYNSETRTRTIKFTSGQGNFATYWGNSSPQALADYANHIILYSTKAKCDTIDTNGPLSLGKEYASNPRYNLTNSYQTLFFVNRVPSSAGSFYIGGRDNTETKGNIYFKDEYTVDLTAMFGTTIADYVYTLETSQSGSGIAWLQSYGFFTEDYYAYTQNKLESGCVSAHKTYDGETLLTNTELSPITLRGLFKLSTDKLTVDGDEYNADGSVTRKRKRLTPTDIFEYYSAYDSTTNLYRSNLKDNLNAITNSSGATNPSNAISNFDTCEATWNKMQDFDHSNKIGLYHNSGWNYTRLYISIADTSVTTKEQAETWIRNNIEAIEYELATPTTEQTTPFTETQITGSTEEFIDYEVAQGNRDVAIPVGTDTDYYQEMKLPPLPTTSGNHNLIYNIATGFGWS